MPGPDAPNPKLVIRRVETVNSVYFIDAGLSRYLRLPRREAPRSHWEMTGADSEWMADGQWLPYEVVLTLDILGTNLKMLQILYPGARVGVLTTPIIHDSDPPDDECSPRREPRP